MKSKCQQGSVAIKQNQEIYVAVPLRIEVLLKVC